jgi:hypothetical protein
MSDFSLLREKFVIRETTDKSSLFVANGNRMKIDVPGVKHPIVIRAHSMHMTLRLASKITEIYEWTKTVEKITETFDWEKMWMDQIEGFEEKYTPHTWVAVYHAGQMIYSYNDHHIFFDILENCEHKNSQSSKKYDQSILMTQKAFEQMGRTVMIEQESHMGFVLDVTDEENRFAITLRLPDHKSTFTTRLTPSRDQTIEPTASDSIMMASDFIETVNLSVQGGFMRKRIEKGKIRNGSDDMKRFKAFQTRCSSLQFSINQMESKYNIKYRPEKPDFKGIEDKCAE